MDEEECVGAIIKMDEVIENPFHSFEIIQAEFVSEGTLIPKPSSFKVSRMVANMMLRNRFWVGKG